MHGLPKQTLGSTEILLKRGFIERLTFRPSGYSSIGIQSVERTIFPKRLLGIYRRTATGAGLPAGLRCTSRRSSCAASTKMMIAAAPSPIDTPMLAQ
jgi:hypothetical protein